MKRTMNKRFLLVLIFAGSCFFSGWSQQPPDSLASYLETAANYNPEVRQKLYEYRAALQKVPQAGSLPDPVLTAGVMLKPMELVNGRQVADLRLMQMFPWFGALRAAKGETGLIAKAKYEVFRNAMLKVNYDVSRSWYELYKIRKSTDITERNLEILQTIERLATVRFKTAPEGSAGLADLYRIQMEEGELRNKVALLKDHDNSIIARLNGYLNRHPETPVFTPDSLVEDTLAVSLYDVSDSILKNNPMLTMLELEKQSYESRSEKARKMSYPMIGLGLDYSVMGKKVTTTSSMNGMDMLMPMVSVTLPLYRKKYKAMVKEADLMKQAASEDYNASVNSLQTEFYEAVKYYRDARRRFNLYGDQYLLASKTLDIMIKSYAASFAPLTDLLRIRQQVYDYELKKEEALADINTATARLRRLMASVQMN
jgi:cobalt-zinc-cadmium efflux system outer membrane protein